MIQAIQVILVQNLSIVQIFEILLELVILYVQLYIYTLKKVSFHIN